MAVGILRAIVAGTTLLLFLIMLQKSSWSGSSISMSRNRLRDIHNKTLGFERLFVLAMPGRYDRQDLWSLASWQTGIEFEYVEGVKGEAIPEKAVPVGWDMSLMKEEPGTLGCYRSHLNFMQKMVTERIQTAIILEDDADWDIMLKSQLTEFARGINYIQTSGADPDTLSPRSPYGDDWDLLWFGHCGVKNNAREDGHYYLVESDPTVLPHHLRSHELRARKPDTTPAGFEGNFTRIIYEASGGGLCTYAYALSLRGAKRFLYNYSIKPQTALFDKAMSRFCSGHMNGAKCYTSYPAIFDQIKQAGNLARDSDRRIGTKLKNSFREKAETWNIAFPVKVSGLNSFVNDDNVVKSQFPADTLYAEIDPEVYHYPRGRGVFVTKDEFKGQQ